MTTARKGDKLLIAKEIKIFGKKLKQTVWARGYEKGRWPRWKGREGGIEHPKVKCSNRGHPRFFEGGNWGQHQKQNPFALTSAWAGKKAGRHRKEIPWPSGSLLKRGPKTSAFSVRVG